MSSYVLKANIWIDKRTKSYIVAVTFIGGGNRSTRRKQPAASHW